MLKRSSTAANRLDCPLLRLLPELRIRIWRLVLGEHRIHIPTHKAWAPYLCLAEEPGVPPDTIVQMSGHPYNFEHQLCRDGGARLQLGLLQACRQIHNDAALVPFTDNHFHYGGVRRISHDPLKLLRATQLESIASLTIVYHPLPCYLYQVPSLRMLSGLKHVHIVVEHHCYAAVPDRTRGILEYLRPKDCRSAAVAIRYCKFQPRCEQDMSQRWADHVRNVLLTPINERQPGSEHIPNEVWDPIRELKKRKAEDYQDARRYRRVLHGLRAI